MQRHPSPEYVNFDTYVSLLCHLYVAFPAGEKLDLLVDKTHLLQGEAALAEQ
jgi:hypothetical protein